MLVPGVRASTPASQVTPNGVPLPPNFTPVVSIEALRHSPGAVANAKQTGDIISLDNENYYLPRQVFLLYSGSVLIVLGSISVKEACL